MNTSRKRRGRDADMRSAARRRTALTHMHIRAKSKHSVCRTIGIVLPIAFECPSIFGPDFRRMTVRRWYQRRLGEGGGDHGERSPVARRSKRARINNARPVALRVDIDRHSRRLSAALRGITQSLSSRRLDGRDSTRTESSRGRGRSLRFANTTSQLFARVVVARVQTRIEFGG